MSIPIKEKPCKAIGKAKGYNGCGTMALKRTYGLCMGCYSNWLLSTPEGKEKLQSATLKATQPRRDLQEQEKKEKEQKSLSALLTATRMACHTYIRLRDKGKPCISCDASWTRDFQAGHWWKAELYSNLKFNEFNINGQCEKCNLFLDGNFQNYANGISKRVGRDKKDELEQMAEDFKSQNFKWDREELKMIKKYYLDKTKELKKALGL